MPSMPTAINSTNVRDYLENTPRVVALALFGWISAVSAAAVSGVLIKLSATEFVALGLFAAGFAGLAYRIYSGVRAFVLSARRRTLARSAIAIDATVLLVALRWLASGMGLDDVAAFPLALAPLVLLPLAVVVHAAQLDGLRAWRAKAIGRGAPNVRSAVAKGPARSPAAT